MEKIILFLGIISMAFAVSIEMDIQDVATPEDIIPEDIEMDFQDVATPEDTIPEDRAACRNLYPDSNCNSWRNPHCTRGQYVSFMAKNCKKTCNKCSSGGSGNSAAVAAVKAHNDERAKYYSGHKVSWSTALASKAEKINRERGCDYKHSPRTSRNRPRRSGENLYTHGWNIGQNVQWGGLKNVEEAFVDAVKEWATEKSLMEKQGYKLRKSYYSGGWGHYSQIVWKKATKIGCAACSPRKYKSSGTVVRCLYDQGNLLGASIY